MDSSSVRRIKSSFHSVFLNKKLPSIEKNKKPYIEELNSVCPLKDLESPSTVAVIPNSIGKSEKFIEKSKVLEILSQLKFIQSPAASNSLKKLKKWGNENNEKLLPVNLSHLFVKKAITPYTPGVVRIRSQTKLRLETRSSSKSYIISRASPIIKKVYEDPIINYKNKIASPVFEFIEQTYENKDWFKGFAKNSMKHGEGAYHYSQFGLTFSGVFFKNKPEGFGILEFSFGYRLECSFTNGIIDDSLAEIIYSNSFNYKGQILKAVRHGKGIIYYPTGEVFKGTWKKDQRVGMGVIINPGEYFFEGFFNYDHTDGPGILIFHNKIPTNYASKAPIEKPEILENIKIFPESQKKSIYLTDLIYLTLPKSDQYLPKEKKYKNSGKFISGKLNGTGIVKYGELGEYTGEFKNGNRHGFGVMNYNDPKHLCKWFNETEGVYTGEWREDKRHGFGVMIWSNGTKYEGMFLNDYRDQVSGKLTFLSGDCYSGTFINNNMANPNLITKPQNS